MKHIFYKKVGRKYQAISEYDSDLIDSLAYGDHLLSVYPGGSSRRKIDPAYAPMIAAGRTAREVIAKKVLKASEMRPTKTPLTPGQIKAWNKLAKEFGDELSTLSIESAYDIADAVVTTLQEEASVLLLHKAVKNAYDEFMLISKLTKDPQ
jgi:hypothetical protein